MDQAAPRRRVIVLVVVLVAVLLQAGTAAASAPPTTSGEAYPPNATVNLLDPFGCAPGSVSGEIGPVEPGSMVQLQLLVAGTGEVLGSSSAFADASGHVDYAIPVPPDRFGAVIVRGTGTNAAGQPFTLDTPGVLVDCPSTLPITGSTMTLPWLRIGAGAVLVGVLLVVIAVRRRTTRAPAR